MIQVTTDGNIVRLSRIETFDPALNIMITTLIRTSIKEHGASPRRHEGTLAFRRRVLAPFTKTHTVPTPHDIDRIAKRSAPMVKKLIALILHNRAQYALGNFDFVVPTIALYANAHPSVQRAVAKRLGL